MTVTINPNAKPKDLKEVLAYLQNIDVAKVEQVYGKGRYQNWHGDGKSQSGTKIIFQTLSMETSGKPPQYITIVAKKGTTADFIKYEAATWDSAATIIDAFITELQKRT